MLRLKPTSRIGKAQIARTGSTLVGSRHEEPRSSNDRASHVDQVGIEVGDAVVILSGPHKGSLGEVKRLGASKFGGSPRVAVEVRRGADPVWLSVDDVMDARVARRRFRRDPSGNEG